MELKFYTLIIFVKDEKFVTVERLIREVKLDNFLWII